MDNTDMGDPASNVECPQTSYAFQKFETSIRRNASERINDGYFNGLLAFIFVS